MIKLKDNTYYEAPSEDVIEWQRAYKKIDVHDELAAMASWCDANPAKRKTRVGVKRFINAWLKRANDNGGSPMAFNSNHAASSGIISTRAMTMLDMQTDNFTCCPDIRALYIERYGQCFENGIRYES